MAPRSVSWSFPRRVLVAVLVVAAFLLVVYMAQVMLLLFAGVLLAVFLDGLASYLSARTPLGHGLALAVVGVVLIGLLVLFGWLAGPDIVEQIAQLGERIPVAITRVRAWLGQHSWGQSLLERLRSPEDLLSSLPISGSTVGQITGAFSAAVTSVVNTLIVLFLGIYLAIDPRLYIDGVVRLVRPERRQRAGEVVQQLGRALRLWLLGRLASMTVIGVLTAIGLLIAGVPLALTLGLIAGVLSFIPYIGPILSVVPAGLIALSESPTTMLYALIVYGAVQLLESYLITPVIERQVVSIPPALLIFAQLLLGVLMGLLGVLLATPLTVAIIVLVQMLYIEDELGDEVPLIGGRGKT